MAFCSPNPNQDMKNRDPYEVNSHVKVLFADVIAEPKGAHSFNFVWDTVTCCYDCWFVSCYNIWAVCCGCCLACEYGIEFAFIAFSHIWCIGPFTKCLEFILWPFSCCYKFCVRCGVDPWCESCGYLFSHFDEKETEHMRWY